MGNPELGDELLGVVKDFVDVVDLGAAAKGTVTAELLLRLLTAFGFEALFGWTLAAGIPAVEVELFALPTTGV